MKRILILTISNIENLQGEGIYSSLYKELSENAIIDILSPNNLKKDFIKIDNTTIYKVESSNIFSSNKFIKAISLLSLNRRYKKVVKKHLEGNLYDLILYTTPPITLNSTIKYLKNKYNAETYLLLKDIFPQNAVDLAMFSNKRLIYKYFRKKEINLYKISDYIGTMSHGNLDYILNNNKVINNTKMEVNPNSIIIKKNDVISETKRENILRKYVLPVNKTLFIYGGNLGIPQGINYIKKVIKENEQTNNHIVIVGDGTEKNKLVNFIKTNHIVNTTFINKLNKDDYDELLKACDVGLIFLDKRFTIPNIPSRLLSYLDYNKPVIAATDVNTDLKDIIEEGNFGHWCESENPNDMIDLFEKIKENDNINVLGNNGRNYLEENYDVKISAKLILDKLKDV